MRTLFAALLLLTGLATASADHRIEQLIRDLGHPEFRVRQKATQSLLKTGRIETMEVPEKAK